MIYNILHRHIHKICVHSTCNGGRTDTSFFKSKIGGKFTLTFSAFETLKFIAFVDAIAIFFDIAKATVFAEI